MTKRQRMYMNIALVVIAIVLVVMLFRKGEKYTPGDTTFFESEIPGPEEATIIQPGELEKGKKYSTPNGEYYLMLRQDGELVWSRDNGELLWFLGSEGAGDNAKARFMKDGNICVIGTNLTMCTESANTEVPEGQHLIILTNSGRFYVDSGGGSREVTNFYPSIDDYRGDEVELN